MSERFDTDRIDDVVRALLWANAFDDHGAHRAWKSLNRDALDRLHAKGLIGNPHSHAYSVTLDHDACERGRMLFQQWFAAAPPQAAAPAAKVDRPATAKAKAKTRAAGAATVHQFKITLDGIKPPIWRRIQLPSDASFWDLHCALNDAMGWEDAHLHEFRLGGRRNGLQIGIPMDDGSGWFDDSGLADWDVPVASHLALPGARCTYLYDFGDDWSHTVLLEDILPVEAKAGYPRCLAGARACPPEDCGGIPGYQHICAALANPADADEDAEELLEWIGDDFDPEAFDPAKVKFSSAARRLQALRSRR